MRVINAILCLILLLSINSCAGKVDGPNALVEVHFIDQAGKLLPFYSLHVIDVKGNWLGIPHTSKAGTVESPITIKLPEHEPAILKFDAPGYQSKFTFLQPPIESVRIDVSLGSPVLLDELNPIVIGDFNDFDSRSGISMEMQENGIWTATMESERDTIHYVINQFAMSSISGTDGNYVVRKTARGFETSIMNQKIKSGEDSAFVIHFDPSEYPSDRLESGLRISQGASDELTGVAKIFSRMVDEYGNFIFSRALHHMRGNEGRYIHDFSFYLTDLDNIQHEYSNQAASNAEKIARLRFASAGDLNLKKSDALGLLNSLSPDSPVWMMHFTALTEAVNIAGLENTLDILSEIAEKTPYEDLAAEALFNIVRYHHQQENEEEWYAAFFELTSNHPQHFRTLYAYESYAPEQPIVEGKTLPYNEFNPLKDGDDLNLYDLDESYLLVDFWSTLCTFSIEEMPMLHDIHARYGDSDFAIVSISLDARPEQVLQFRSEWEMPWYHGHEQQLSEKIIEMGIVGTPFFILLGPDRTVVTSDQSRLRGENLQVTLQEYLND